ncbi:DUF3078 domain-containing protein [Parafilimonas sp.]|uniref:DUF3078 domain-containing protein n=1 Tax=Parafilimonas sp. TaxID=1969739 RepID=UPI0039E32D83
MKKFLFIIFLPAFYPALSQDATVQDLKTESSKTITKDANDTIPKIWKTGGIISVNLTQGSLNNWSAGGEKFSLSLNSLLSTYAFYKKNKHSWDNLLTWNVGYVKTTSLGTRKNDDRVEFLSKYGYALNPKLNLSGLFDVRSQFFKGYTYDDDGLKTYTSNFFAPGYVLLSPGLDYHPVKNLSIFVSPATARWTIVTADSLKESYGVDVNKTADFQFGTYASVSYLANIGKAITYTGKLDLFSNYKSNPQNVDLYMTNLFAAKISRILSVTYSLTLIYDDDVRQFGPNGTSAGLQLQSLFGAGLLVKFDNYTPKK